RIAASSRAGTTATTLGQGRGPGSPGRPGRRTSVRQNPPCPASRYTQAAAASTQAATRITIPAASHTARPHRRRAVRARRPVDNQEWFRSLPPGGQLTEPVRAVHSGAALGDGAALGGGAGGVLDGGAGARVQGAFRGRAVARWAAGRGRLRRAGEVLLDGLQNGQALANQARGQL